VKQRCTLICAFRSVHALSSLNATFPFPIKRTSKHHAFSNGDWSERQNSLELLPPFVSLVLIGLCVRPVVVDQKSASIVTYLRGLQGKIISTCMAVTTWYFRWDKRGHWNVRASYFRCLLRLLPSFSHCGCTK